MYNLNYAPTTLGYKVDENIYLGVHERKRLSITGVGHYLHTRQIQLPGLLPTGVPT